MSRLGALVRFALERSENGQLKLSDRAHKAVGMARAYALLRGCETGERVRVHGSVHVQPRGRIALGDNVFLLEGPIPVELSCAAGGELVIGAGTGINYGASLDCRGSIRIGDRCMLGSFVRISDHRRDLQAPVVIGDGVWLAHGAIVEPGVTIGDGAVVSAGAVVTADVPPRTMAVGNPARSMPLTMVRGGA